MRAALHLVAVFFLVATFGAQARAYAVFVGSPQGTDDNVTFTFVNDLTGYPEDATVETWRLWRTCPSVLLCTGPVGVPVLVAEVPVEEAAQFDENGDPSGYALVDRLEDGNGDRLPDGTHTYDYHVDGVRPGPTYTVSSGVVPWVVTMKAPRPRPPAIDASVRPVHVVEDFQFTVDPHVPPHRTTADGRVAIKVSGSSENPPVRGVDFMLFAPETLGQPLHLGPPGISMTQSRVHVTFGELGAPAGANSKGGMGALCEHQENPTPCPDDTTMDCYEITVVRWLSDDLENGGARQWMGTPVTVSVSNPKTPQAAIHEIDIGTAALGPPLSDDKGNPPEPMITRDGRLLVARSGNHLNLIPQVTPGAVTPPPGLFYMVYPEEEGGEPTPPCDVTRWTVAHPIDHAYYDPEMNPPGGPPRYGIAAYPIRDPQGELIPDSEIDPNLWIFVTYPWIDRDGDNFFYTSVAATLFYFEDVPGVGAEVYDKLYGRYPSTCVTGTSEPCRVHPDCFVDIDDPDCPLEPGNLTSTAPFAEDGSKYRGMGVAGLWTHGKMVLFDNMLNNIDYGLPAADAGHRMVTLYRDGSGTDQNVRLGTGRELGPGWQGQPLSASNTTMIDSLESIFSYDPNLRPRTPREVVWHMSTGKTTDEVVFDDYLDRDMLVFADMNASQSWFERPFKVMGYFDGFNYGDGPGSTVPRSFTGRGFGEEQRLQNAATSPDFVLPPYGLLRGSTRIEPVALGGVVGKGLWLDGTSGATFSVAEDHSAEDSFTSLFYDAREAGTVMRRLVTYPDGSYVALRDHETLILVTDAGTAHAVEIESTPGQRLHPAGSWNHLAWSATGGGAHVDLYVNGYPFDTVTADAGESFFRLAAGDLTLGYAADWAGVPADGAVGFRGWVDELRVRVATPNPATICNQARGRLVMLESGGSSIWHDWAAGFANGHAAIANLLAEPGSGVYACVHDYTTADALPVDDPAIFGELVGAEIRTLNGPLVWSDPRPESGTNPFCLSCHVNGGELGLDVAALAEIPGLSLHDDPRRQPMQPAPVLSGNIPANLAGLGNPGPQQTLPSLPFNLDMWLHPGDADLDGIPDHLDDACDNGVDDDGDGFTDFPADAGCSTATWPDRENPACNDGIDNDGDGAIDSADLACGSNGARPDEAPECQDGIDNDGDGFIDFPDDPECGGYATTLEGTGGCGLLGLEVLPLLAWIAARRRRRS